MISQTVHIRDILGHRQRISEKMCPTSAPERAHQGHKGAEIHLFPLTFPIEFSYREIYPKIVYLCPTCALSGPRAGGGIPGADVPKHDSGGLSPEHATGDHKVGDRCETRSGCHHERLRGILADGYTLLLDHRVPHSNRDVLRSWTTRDGPTYHMSGDNGSGRHQERLSGICEGGV